MTLTLMVAALRRRGLDRTSFGCMLVNACANDGQFLPSDKERFAYFHREGASPYGDMKLLEAVAHGKLFRSYKRYVEIEESYMDEVRQTMGITFPLDKRRKRKRGNPLRKTR